MKTITLLSATFLLLLSACGVGGKKGEQMPPMKLQAAQAIQEVVPNRMTFVSQTAAIHSYTIEPRVAGYLVSVNYSAGTFVKKGALLFTIDASPFNNQLAQQRANLASSQAQLAEAENNYKRGVPLAKINAISQSQLDSYTAALESARESVKAAQASLRDAQLNVNYTTIESPGDGIISTTSSSVGDYVGPGTQFSVLATVSDNKLITVNLSLPTKEYYSIVGRSHSSNINDSLLSDITMQLSDGIVYPLKGTYRYTAQTVNNQSGAIVLQVGFENPQGVLKAGEFARVSANVGEPSAKILIPQRCVNEIQGEYSVWVVKDGVAEYRKVTVGQTIGQQWIIESGLSKGETVLTEGFAKLRSGAKVEVVLNKK